MLLFLAAARMSGELAIRPADPDSALNACVATGSTASGKKSAADAEKLYRSLIARDDSDLKAKTLLARTLSQCVMSHASVWSKDGIVKESISLVKAVLGRDSTNWEARYTLALDYYHAPAFYGWRDNAIREFEHLLGQQGNQTLFSEQAKPYVYLGELYERAGRHADAVTVWQRGSKLFPDDRQLRERADRP
jgi:cytochrome c-type biogenesis protein CcmH/NrfG